MPDSGGTERQRLIRLEDKVDEIRSEVTEMRRHVDTLQQAEDRRYTDRLLPERVRALEDQILQMRVYLSQLKWVIALALAGLLTGLINIGLSWFVLGGHGP